MTWDDSAKEFQASLDRLLTARKAEMDRIERAVDKLLVELADARRLTSALEEAAKVIRKLRSQADGAL